MFYLIYTEIRTGHSVNRINGNLDADITKINDEDSREGENKDGDESEDEGSKTIDEESNTGISQDLDSLSTMTDEEMLTRRSNVWESTSIGNRDERSSGDFRGYFQV